MALIKRRITLQVYIEVDGNERGNRTPSFILDGMKNAISSSENLGFHFDYFKFEVAKEEFAIHKVI
jgi:hypothetical protein